MKRHNPSLRFNITPSSLGLSWLPRITVRRSVVGSACHWHTHDEHEIIFLLNGAATYAFRNRPPVNLTGGSFLVIPKGLEHHMLDDIDAPSFRLGFNLSANPNITPSPFRRIEHRETLSALLTTRLTARPFSTMTKANLLALAKLITSHADNKALTPIAAARFRSLCTLVVANCAAEIREIDDTSAMSQKNGKTDLGRVQSGTTHGEHIDAAIKFIECHTDKPLDLKALVAHVGYSRSRLFVLFQQKTGLSPAAYHLRQRLARAQQLLDETALTSEQVAERLGFESSAYFTYAFRRHCGMTPIAFRKRGERMKA